jgi:hypothetical protein
LANILTLGTAGIEEIQALYPTLLLTTVGVLTLALNLPYKEYPFTIFLNNLFTGYKLFSILRSYGIGACGTVQANRMLGNFAKEIQDKNNRKLIQ